jgi:hypothetical protein
MPTDHERHKEYTKSDEVCLKYVAFFSFFWGGGEGVWGRRGGDGGSDAVFVIF